ncbi:lysoplasmalogenase family protein [Cognataquiflexum rubidum]|uniref:lysoplasmalogenase family protein n=1 Tax=Cognataquiflexum rubidum TaxID=2922273 RepID=UPI001F145B52|nr:lysoplasmalogenase family protein [Cognataquiflexum rubidum]MCH6235432.1 lysoplasmalogenase [Cognataquiflexum rubidum]
MLVWNTKFSVFYISTAILAITFLLLDIKAGFYLFNLMTVPILVLGLLLKFKKNPHPLMSLMIVASIFSFAGDLLMLLEIEESMFKTIGICTFIVAQTCYGLLYYFSTQFTEQNIKPSLVKRWPELIALIVLGIYASVVLEYTNEFFLPGLLYSFFGVSTFILALNRRFFVSQRSFILVFIGAFLFILSASLTGFDMYATNKISYAVAILLYAGGHYFCSFGILSQIEEIIHKEVPEKSIFE